MRQSPPLSLACSILLFVVLFLAALPGTSLHANTLYQPLPFSQNWADTTLITASNDWSAVPGIVGLRGQGMVSGGGVDPQTILGSDATGVRVTPNLTNPLGSPTNGIGEFHLADPVVAIAVGGTSPAPHLIFHVDASASARVTVSYRLRDLEGAGGTDNAVVPVALQFRVGESGSWTNVPAGFVADASAGPGLTLETNVSAVLPPAAGFAAQLQIRVLTSQNPGGAEWIGVDDIVVTGSTPASFADITPSMLAGGGNSRGAAWGYHVTGILGFGTLFDLYTTQVGTANKLFRYAPGTGTWTQDSTAAVGGTGQGAGVIWGSSDLITSPDYLISSGTQLLSVKPSDVTGNVFQTTAVATAGDARSMSRADFDLDGDNDVFVAQAGSPSLFLRRSVSGVYESIAPSGLPLDGDAHGADWADFDGDGDPDLLIARSSLPSVIARNQGGGTFDTLGFGAIPTTSARAATWADFDGDGDLDVFLTRKGAGCVLLRNDAGTWSNQTPPALAGASAWRGASWADFDLDGDLDLYVGRLGGNGVLLRNEAPAWVEVTGESAPLAISNVVAVTWNDLDTDGDPDLFVTCEGGPNHLLRNQTVTGRHWLQVRPSGRHSPNTSAGLRVRAVVGGVSSLRVIPSGSGYLSQGLPIAAFGLGSASVVDSVIVEWPMSPPSILTNVTAVDTTIVLIEPFTDFERRGFLLVAQPGPELGASWRHSRRVTGDPLLVTRDRFFRFPADTDFVFVNAESNVLQSGSAFLLGAVDPGQSSLDLIESGGDFGTRFLVNTGGAFSLAFADSSTPAWSALPGSVASGASWVDVDGDGDLDAHVLNPNSSSRLLRRDAPGTWVDITPVAFAAADSAMHVAWGDIDADGDLDVFFSRSGGPHRLVRHDPAGWTDVTSGSIAAMAVAGEGLDASFSDFDDDGDLDLLSIDSNGAHLHRNDSGAWIDATTGPLAGLGPGIVGASWVDLDLDGHQDLFVGRRGGGAKLLFGTGSGAFVDRTALPFTLPLEASGVPAFVDRDGDGDADMFVPVDGLRGAAALYRNHMGTGRHWFHLELQGVSSNSAGVGARVELVAGGLRQTRIVTGDLDYLSQSASPLMFGLGSATVIDTIRIHWPSGARFDTTGVAVDQWVIWPERTRVLDAPHGIALPPRLELVQRGANPFSSQLSLGYTLPIAGVVRLTLHDVQGRQVAVLAAGAREAGTHAVRWTSQDGPAGRMAPGVYMARLVVVDSQGSRERQLKVVRVR